MGEHTCNCGKEGLFLRSGVVGTSVVVFGFQRVFRLLDYLVGV